MPTPLFTVPALDLVRRPKVDTDVVSVRAWIGQLPTDDPVQMTGALLRSLATLNRYPERIGTRAELLAEYRIPCARLVHPGPAPANPDRNELRLLMMEMAYGYKHLVNETLGQPAWRQNRARLLQGLYFAVKYLSLELFLAFEGYDCRTAVSWREVFGLYRLAERENLHQSLVQDPELADPAGGTLSHQLKRILLLKLLDPCHLLPGEARACFDYFDRWATLARIETLPEVSNPVGRYSLDLDGQLPPQPLESETPCEDPARFRYLNILGISRQAHIHLQRMGLNNAPPPAGLDRLRGLSPDQVLKHMLTAWHARPERRADREECLSWVRCGFGLSSVSHFLQLDPLLAAADTTTPLGEGSSAITTQPHPPRPPDPSARPTQHRCRQLNWSLGGACLELTTAADSHSSVGQLLLLEEDLPRGFTESRIGIVRHQRQVEMGVRLLGVQFVRGLVTPISVRRRGDSRFHPALWVERPDALSLSSVLLPPGICQPGRELLVEQGPATAILTEQLIEATPSFERYSFRPKGR